MLELSKKNRVAVPVPVPTVSLTRSETNKVLSGIPRFIAKYLAKSNVFT